MKTWTHPDRAAEHQLTVPGPWDDEPDKAQWIDEATGLDCLAVRNHMGAWCGYVGVPPGHPCHGKGYGELELDAHGELTFADACDEGAAEGHGICHVPEPGRPADIWWLGFDCAHCFDIIPGREKYSIGTMTGATYKDLAYVRSECARLAAQLAPEALHG